MEIYTLYVGQGAFSVLTHGGEAIIIDTHIPSSADKDAVFIKGLLPRLLTGRKLVGLMLTSFDADHANPVGTALIINRYCPHWVMYPKYWKGTQTADAVMEEIIATTEARRGGSREIRRISVRLDLVRNRFFNDLADGLTVEVFSPHPEDMTSSNNCSLVARIEPRGTFTGFSYLVTGDTENPRWESINRIFGSSLRSDVMAAPHHGSANGINAQTLALVRPNVALISAGIDNPYSHPHQEAVDTYQARGVKLYSTHDGTSLRTYGGGVGSIRTDPWSIDD